MTLSTTIHVSRDDEDVAVTVEGRVEYFGSHNPYESGQRVVDVTSDIDLTPDEQIRAEEALEGLI